MRSPPHGFQSLGLLPSHELTVSHRALALLIRSDRLCSLVSEIPLQEQIGICPEAIEVQTVTDRQSPQQSIPDSVAAAALCQTQAWPFLGSEVGLWLSAVLGRSLRWQVASIWLLVVADSPWHGPVVLQVQACLQRSVCGTPVSSPSHLSSSAPPSRTVVPSFPNVPSLFHGSQEAD